MSVNPLPPGTPGPATIARIGFELAGAINRAIGGGISRADKEALEAGRAAGYRQTRQGWIAADGGRVTERTVIQAGRQVLEQPGGPRYRPDLTETRGPTVADRPPAPTKAPPKVPKLPGRAGRIIEGAIAVGAGSGLFEVIRGGVTRVMEPGATVPQPAPRVPEPPSMAPPGASWPEIAGPRPPFVPPAAQPRPAAPVPTVKRQPAAPPAPTTPIDTTERLSPIDVYTPYAAIPAAPAPTGAPTAGSRSVLGLTPAQLASIAVPSLLALLASSSSSRSRRRDPLTVPQTPSGFPGLGLTPGGLPLPFPGSGFGGSGGGARTLEDQCRELAKRKRKPKKRRDVCYSGRYIERASGLSKTKLRKVPCR